MARHPQRDSSSVRTKIVCTLGPSSSDKEVIRRMILAGADVFRLNFSHGTHEDHLTRIRTIRELGYEMGRPFAILGDLCGPKLRLGMIEGGETTIVEGDLIVLTSNAADGTGKRFNVNFAGFHEVAQTGESIVLDDGRFHVIVEEIKGQDVVCRVINGGILKSRKGVNLPDTKLPIPALTEKDCKDLRFALDNGVDLIALSFVRSPEDITMAREEMKRHGRVIPILAKIEKKEAVARLDEVVREADGAMVARGDLGIEMWLELVPAIQKRIIQLCNRLAKPVITATQMLESMTSCPRPTRAETADVYNAILDGTDAVMLSAETAAGQYPIDAVQVMNNIAAEAEKALRAQEGIDWSLQAGETPSLTHVLCNSAVLIAERLKLDLILVPTQTGHTVYHLSRFKPTVPIFACATDPATVNWLCLAWGVTPRTMPELRKEDVALSETDALVNEVIRVAKHHGIARPGQRAVVLGGVPLGKSRHTNYLKVVEIR